MDEELFHKLFEQGFISDKPSEMWLPMNTKDRMWQNYYSGRDGTTMHLDGGWMINPDTYELKQLEGYDNEIDTVGDNLKENRLSDEPGNLEQKFYSLQDALDSDEYKNAEGSLLFPVGKDESGKFAIADLHKLPHIMAGGQTGSGKSNFTEGTLILSLIKRYSSDDLRLLLIDPKCVQFTQYNSIPHLLRPVITTPEDSKAAMDWLLNEMENRFTAFVDSKTKNIVEYNSSGKGHMPFIVLIIDEVADLMMVDDEYYQKSFIKLLQKSAAVGIHIYIGTSRPSEDVLPSLLRANFVAKIAFKTASKVDSEALIDVSGAEKLQGRGDLLFCSLDSPHPVHLQAPYVSDKESASVAESLKTDSM